MSCTVAELCSPSLIVVLKQTGDLLDLANSWSQQLHVQLVHSTCTLNIFLAGWSSRFHASQQGEKRSSALERRSWMISGRCLNSVIRLCSSCAGSARRCNTDNLPNDTNKALIF